jgi:hypothetical protein
MDENAESRPPSIGSIAQCLKCNSDMKFMGHHMIGPDYTCEKCDKVYIVRYGKIYAARFVLPMLGQA